MNNMFGKSKEKDRIVEINVGSANVFYVSIETEQGKKTVFPITTTLSESEIRTLVEDYINQKGELDFGFVGYNEENGYQYEDIMQGSCLDGHLVETYVLFIYN